MVGENQFEECDKNPLIDLGVVMQTMIMAAHAQGLGSGPVPSFSKEALRAILTLPVNLTPEEDVCLVYAASKGDTQLPMRSKKRTTWRDFTDWERFES